MAAWNQDRSVLLSLVCTRLIMALAVALVMLLAVLNVTGLEYLSLQPGEVFTVMVSYYLFCVPAAIALVLLDRLLAAVRRGEVFTKGNVRLLRGISWCCFGAGAVLVIGCFVTRPLFPLFADALIIVAVLAAFFGSILRVVKTSLRLP